MRKIFFKLVVLKLLFNKDFSLIKNKANVITFEINAKQYMQLASAAGRFLYVL